MKSKIFYATIFASMTVITGCDLINKNKNEKKLESAELSDWSCTAPSNVKEIERFAQEEYVRIIDRRLGASDYYKPDLNLLSQINSSIRFELKSITTSDQTNSNNQLNCSSQLVVHLPKGLGLRAENAYKEAPCEYECEHGDAIGSLRDYIAEVYDNVTFGQDQVRGPYRYEIIKTDKEGQVLNISSTNGILDAVAKVTYNAVQFEAFRKDNLENSKNYEKYKLQNQQEQELASKAMQLRKSDIEKEQTSVVERLNLTWDNLNAEQKENLKADQTKWFERRDIDCKVLSQKAVTSIAEKERETYQQHYQYWDESMYETDRQMQYMKCFIQKTNERIVYLNNSF